MMFSTGRLAEEEASIANTESLHNVSTVNLVLAAPVVSVTEASAREIAQREKELQFGNVLHMRSHKSHYANSSHAYARKSAHVTHLFTLQTFSHTFNDKFFSEILFFDVKRMRDFTAEAWCLFFYCTKPKISVQHPDYARPQPYVHPVESSFIVAILQSTAQHLLGILIGLPLAIIILFIAIVVIPIRAIICLIGRLLPCRTLLQVFALILSHRSRRCAGMLVVAATMRHVVAAEQARRSVRLTSAVYYYLTIIGRPTAGAR